MDDLGTVLGYTTKLSNSNGHHCMSTTDFIHLIAKKLSINGKFFDFTEKILNEFENEETWEIELYDDIIVINPYNPEMRSVTLENYDECSMEYVLAYKKCPDILIGNAFCFEGIIVDIVNGDCYKPKKSIKYRLNMAKRWINELHQQSRINKDEWSLVNVGFYCCS